MNANILKTQTFQKIIYNLKIFEINLILAIEEFLKNEHETKTILNPKSYFGIFILIKNI